MNNKEDIPPVSAVKNQPDKFDVVLKNPHEHLGWSYKKGDTLTVNAYYKNLLESLGVI